MKRTQNQKLSLPSAVNVMLNLSFIKRKPLGPGYRSIYSAAKQALGFTGRQREQRITIKLPLSEGTG